LVALLAALVEAYCGDREVDDATRREIATVRRLLAPVVGARPAAAEPTRSHLAPDELARAVAATAAHFPALAAALAPIGHDLPWLYGYAPRPDLPGIETRMGWAEIVGPVAPFVSHDVCLGLTFIAPATLYPAHDHPAVELYRIVAGHPWWTVGGRTQRQAPGDAILHESAVTHAMESDVEPLLAIYSWTGDILSPSTWS
jgi:hypothetical protein